VASVGTLIALGAILGTLLADSGGADLIVDTVLARTSPKRLPWPTALIAGLVGLPLFFEIGIVTVIPVIPVVLLVARRGGQSLIRNRRPGGSTSGRRRGATRPGRWTTYRPVGTIRV
jgi:GntP family gluconate:H+ symporter